MTGVGESDRHVEIAVLGAGPAGVVAALGLAATGNLVAVVSSPRRFVAIEGISDRAIEGLRAAGCHEVL